MKWIGVLVILALWAGYVVGHDTEPAPRWFHAAVHIGYAALTLAAVMWL